MERNSLFTCSICLGSFFRPSFRKHVPPQRSINDYCMTFNDSTFSCVCIYIQMLTFKSCYYQFQLDLTTFGQRISVYYSWIFTDIIMFLRSTNCQRYFRWISKKMTTLRSDMVEFPKFASLLYLALWVYVCRMYIQYRTIVSSCDKCATMRINSTVLLIAGWPRRAAGRKRKLSIEG